MLPNKGIKQYRLDADIKNEDITGRISHLVSLTKGLLPSDKAPKLSSRVRAFIVNDENEEEDDFLSLRIP
ncbi:hypothetical protein C0995_008868 [Termitomyces sp. Mi166|nr:hypothetical protein C0995_008868 [Termitomyces sp. Mi166\